MTTAATAYPLIGSQPVGNFFVPDTTQRHPLGSIITFNDPYWGGGEAIYLQMPASTALKVGHILAYDTATADVASAAANTANLGKSIAFLMNAVASNASAQYAWCIISGQFPVYSNASVAADTGIGIVAAGQAGAQAAGKQILNCRVTKPATTTVVKANTQQFSSTVLRATVGGTDGWFVGVALSGTGVGAAAVINAIDPDNRTVTASVVSTASNSVSVTGTYNDATSFWNVCTFNRPFLQGAIT
jgi:hypothetical protein